jgi:drug/metabolite transporter (DMT)-like permease
MIGAVVYAPFLEPIAAEVDATDLLKVGYLGTFQIGLAYELMTRGVRAVPALEVSLLVGPVVAALWAWLLLGETLGRWAAAGCALILGATLARMLAAHAGRPGPLDADSSR